MNKKAKFVLGFVVIILMIVLVFTIGTIYLESKMSANDVQGTKEPVMALHQPLDQPYNQGNDND